MSTLTTRYQFVKPAVSGDADAWGGPIDTNFDNIDTFLGLPRMKKLVLGSSATTILDFSLANFFDVTVGQATTVSMTNVPATLPDATVPFIRAILKLTNGGAFTITWPGSIVWPFETANVAPTGLAPAGVDVIELVSYDAGTTWYAMLHHIKVDPNLWPRVSVYKSADQSIGLGVITVTFDSERFDVGAMHDTVTNNSRLTVPANQGGLYHITAKLNYRTNLVYGFRVRKNGATILREEETQSGLLNDFISLYEVLVAGDYVEILVNNADSFTGTVVGGLTRSSFEMVRVR